ncbi:MAG: Stp1/IreP family PP2C-type Ser/Thr phosphatase [Deltaproteobacteria bacterium]|nr:Stp1/IreP family PP2C-type Ser/Thr phosphatase [Deltaproteobacteria bacterium]
MRLAFSARTDVGRQRDHNEDNFLVDKSLKLFIVADGMGGHAAGEEASALCVRRVHKAVESQQELLANFAKKSASGANRDDVLQLLEHAVQSACQAIYNRAQDDPQKRGMGTTCSLLMIAGERGFIAHVGDSRVYLMRHGQVHQLSEDHSLINELIRRGKLKADEVESSPYRDYKNAVTRAVGVYESVEVDTLDFDVLPGDRFLLCSDGLHHYFDAQQDALSALLQKDDAETAVKEMVDFANEGGGHDNITSLVVMVEATEEADHRAKEVTLKLETLMRMQLFRYLSYKEIVRVLNITEVRDFNDGDKIITEGEAATELFIILQGEVRLHKGDAFITTLGPGDHLGEMALVDTSPRSASASAIGRTRVLVVRRRDFYDIMRNESQLSVKLLWSFVEVLAQRLRRTTAELAGERFEASLPDLTDMALFDDDSIANATRARDLSKPKIER